MSSADFAPMVPHASSGHAKSQNAVKAHLSKGPPISTQTYYKYCQKVRGGIIKEGHPDSFVMFTIGFMVHE